jgi:hypothetical protein
MPWLASRQCPKSGSFGGKNAADELMAAAIKRAGTIEG